jgi:hypothetical protein
MSISLRKFRAKLYDYADAGTGGEVNATYELHTSGASDDAYWASVSQPEGEEVTTGMKAEHRVDAIIGLSGAAPVTENGAVVVDSVEYLVRAILAKQYGTDEWQVKAERSPNALSRFDYTTMALTGSATVTATAPAGGPNPSNQTRIVARTGTGSVVLAGPVAVIAYSGAPGQSWLAAVRSGSDPSYTYTLSFTVGALTAAVYTATVTITDANVAARSALVLTVTFTVT